MTRIERVEREIADLKRRMDNALVDEMRAWLDEAEAASQAGEEAWRAFQRRDTSRTLANLRAALT
jgi:hypothetical protein